MLAGHAHRRSLRRAVFAVVVGTLLVLPVAAVAGGGEAPGQGRVLQVTVDGTITPVMADHVEDAVDRGEADGYEALLVRLDTPGGLDSSMRDIAQALLNAEIPTIVWVGPSGARAASAGVIITLASHVAAMAPGTTIGAATPVDLQGGDVEEKVVNDATAYAESLAKERGRDVEFARNAVLEAEAVTARQALDRGVVEFVADGVGNLLDQVDETEVTLTGERSVTLETAGAPLDEHDLGTFRSILQWLADPNLAFMFISVGTLALIYEFANPGVGAGGIVGAILLILAFFSLSVLPVNAAGALLLLLAAGLFVGELFVPGIGVLAAGGVASLILGGLFLFRGSFGVDAEFLWPTALVVGGSVVLIARFAWRTRRAPHTSGSEMLRGQATEIRVVRGGRAQVFLEGAWWSVRTTGEESLEEGQQVEVVDVDGLELVVQPTTIDTTVSERTEDS